MGRLIRVITSRLVQGFVVALAVASLTFVVVNVTPGDLALQIAVARHDLESVTPAMVEQIRKEEGLEGPVMRRYFRWLARTLRFDLGCSLVNGRPVGEELIHRFSYTARLAGAGLLVSFLLAVPLGIASGIRPGRGVDRFSELLSSVLTALPSFVIGVFFVLVFAIKLHWLPAAGFTGIRHMVLPALTLGIGLAALSTRIVATAVADVRSRFYYRFARMKGLGGMHLILRHGIKNAAIPVLTLLGIQFAHLLDGAVVIETLFAWPGMGRFLLEGILARDIPVVQGAGLLIGFTYVAVNMAVDVLCVALSPSRNPGEAPP